MGSPDKNMNGIPGDSAVSLYNDEELIALKSGTDYKKRPCDRLISFLPTLNRL